MFVGIFLPTGDPLLELAFLPHQVLVLLGQLPPNRLEFSLLSLKFGAPQPKVVGQFRADAAQRPGQGGRWRGTGELGPKLFGGQAEFQRFAVHLPKLGA